MSDLNSPAKTEGTSLPPVNVEQARKFAEAWSTLHAWEVPAHIIFGLLARVITPEDAALLQDAYLFYAEEGMLNQGRIDVPENDRLNMLLEQIAQSGHPADFDITAHLPKHPSLHSEIEALRQERDRLGEELRVAQAELEELRETAGSIEALVQEVAQLRTAFEKKPVSDTQCTYYIVWSAKDGAYVATSPKFPSLSGAGNTAFDALESLITLINMWKREFQ
jgi:hypothetical protein